MTTGRIEAFSDAVIAIIMTVMVLEFKAPATASFDALTAIAPNIAAYAASFIFLGVYWNNHHQVFQAVEQVNGATLWANQFLLFWLSLIPFGTAWMANTHFAKAPVACYGLLLIMSGVAFRLLTTALVAANGKESNFAKGLGRDFKGTISAVIYVIGTGVAVYNQFIALGLFGLVMVIWLVPDRRFLKPE